MSLGTEGLSEAGPGVSGTIEPSGAGALPALHVEAVSKSYGSTKALDHVSITVAPGEVHGIVGENGAGKSTLIGVISGGVIADAGEVRVGGEVLASAHPLAARRAGVAVVHQEPRLISDLSVEENMYLAVAPTARPALADLRGWARDVLAPWTAQAPIDPRSRVEQLTPEARFVVALCSALFWDPRVLLLDEPTEHLGHEGVTRLMEQVRDCAARGQAIVYISHRLTEVRVIADRLTVLREGRSQGTFEVREVTEDDVVRMIVGREIGAMFPPKRAVAAGEVPSIVIGETKNRAVSAPALEIRPGEIVGLAGIEGSGQREYLRAMGGLAHGLKVPRVQIGERRVSVRSSARAARAGITSVSGDRHREGLLTGLSVRENLTLRSLRQVSVLGVVRPSRDRTLARDLVRRFDVRPPDLNSNVDALSGGNQQKVVLAAAVATRCRLLLVEEPTQGVDVGTRAAIYDLLRKQADEGELACVVASSNAAELAGLCDRVLVFSRGHVVRVIEARELTEQTITETVLRSDAVRAQGVANRRLNAEWLAGDTAPSVLVAALIILVGLVTFLANASFLGGQNLGDMMQVAVPLVFVSLAQGTALLAGVIDLSIGPLMGLLLAMESFYWAPHAGGGEFVLGLVLIVVVPIGVGILNWLLADGLGLHPMVATIVTFFGLEAVGLMVRPTPGGVIDSHVLSTISFSVGKVPAGLVIAVVVSCAMAYGLIKWRGGLALRAVGGDDGNARINGLHPKTVRLFAYVGCSLISMLAAIALMGQVGYGDPSVGTSYTLASIAAAIIGGISLSGGRGSFVGALLGALLLQEALSVTTFLNLSAAWDNYLEALLILGAVLLYSKGRKMFSQQV